MNIKVSHYLDQNYTQNASLIQGKQFTDLVDMVIAENQGVFNLDTGMVEPMFSPEDLRNLHRVKTNKKINLAFDQAIRLIFDNQALETQLVEELKQSLVQIKVDAGQNKSGFTQQLILIEYDSYTGQFYGYGPANYTVSPEPVYLKYNWRQELYSRSGNITLEQIFRPLNSLNELLETWDEECDADQDYLDMMYDTELYCALYKAYQYKMYQLLHLAFDQIPLDAFEGIDTILPMHVFAQEHDQPATCIYVYQAG